MVANYTVGSADSSVPPPSSCMPRVPAAVPPQAFNPLTATDAALACYGLPARPTDPTSLQHWQWIMQHIKRYVYPASALGSPVGEGAPYGQIGTSAGNWAGYHLSSNQNTQWPYAKWFQVDADVVVRTVTGYSSGGCANLQLGSWIGLGGVTTSNNLSQIGVEQKTSNPATYRAWWQVASSQSPVTITEVPVHPGDTISLEVHYNEGQASTTFFIENVTTGLTTSFTKGAADPDQDADFEVEEPPSWPYGPFINFSHIPFSYTDVYGEWGTNGQNLLSKTLDQTNYVQDDLVNQSNQYPASPNAYGSEPYGFDVYADSRYASC